MSALIHTPAPEFDGAAIHADRLLRGDYLPAMDPENVSDSLQWKENMAASNSEILSTVDGGPACVSVIGTIVADRPWLEPHGTYTEKFATNFCDTKLQFTLANPGEFSRELGTDFDKAVHILNVLQLVVCKLRPEASSPFDPDDRQDPTMSHPVADGYKALLEATAKTHSINHIPFYDHSDNLMDPAFIKQLCVGAVVEVVFTLNHWAMKAKKSTVTTSDTFVARVVQLRVLRRSTARDVVNPFQAIGRGTGPYIPPARAMAPAPPALTVATPPPSQPGNNVRVMVPAQPSPTVATPAPSHSQPTTPNGPNVQRPGFLPTPPSSQPMGLTGQLTLPPTPSTPSAATASDSDRSGTIHHPTLFPQPPNSHSPLMAPSQYTHVQYPSFSSTPPHTATGGGMALGSPYAHPYASLYSPNGWQTVSAVTPNRAGVESPRPASTVGLQVPSFNDEVPTANPSSTARYASFSFNPPAHSETRKPREGDAPAWRPGFLRPSSGHRGEQAPFPTVPPSTQENRSTVHDDTGPTTASTNTVPTEGKGAGNESNHSQGEGSAQRFGAVDTTTSTNAVLPGDVSRIALSDSQGVASGSVQTAAPVHDVGSGGDGDVVGDGTSKRKATEEITGPETRAKKGKTVAK